MGRSLMLAMALLMLWPMLASAKPKEQTFSGTRQQVFEACLTAARQNYVITSADEKHFLIIFEQGGGMFHGEIMFNVVVGPEKDGKVTVSLNYQGKRGKPMGGNLAGHYFERVKQALVAADKKP
jgi:hypothetical protein